MFCAPFLWIIVAQLFLVAAIRNTYSLARLRPGEYTYSVLQEFGGAPPSSSMIFGSLEQPEEISLSLSNYATFIRALCPNPDSTADADKIAASALSGVHPLLEGELTHDLWITAFYGCKLAGEDNDTVLQRVFRLGLIKCARLLRSMGIYDVSHYLYPRDRKHGDSLLHLATRKGNTQLVELLGDILHGQIRHLLEGSFAMNDDGLNPYQLASRLNEFAVKDVLSSLHIAYPSAPRLPPPPNAVHSAHIDLVIGDKKRKINSEQRQTILNDKGYNGFYLKDLTRLNSTRSSSSEIVLISKSLIFLVLTLISNTT